MGERTSFMQQPYFLRLAPNSAARPLFNPTKICYNGTGETRKTRVHP